MTQDPILRGYSSMTGCHLYYTPPKWESQYMETRQVQLRKEWRAMEKGGLGMNKLYQIMTMWEAN